MTLLRFTAVPRSINAAVIHNTRAIIRLPLVASRTFVSGGPQVDRPQDILKNAPGWKHENASQSEANVKADRSPHPADVRSLQNESVEHLKRSGAHGNTFSSTTQSAAQTARGAVEDLKKKAQSMGENISEQSKEYTQKAKQVGENMVENTMDSTRTAGEYAAKQGQEMAGKAQTEADRMKKGAEQKGEKVMENVKSGAEKVKQEADAAASSTDSPTAENVLGSVKSGAEKVKKGAEATGENVIGSVKTGAQKVTQFVKESVDSAKKAVGMDK